MNGGELWERYRTYLYHNPELSLILDISRMNFPSEYFATMQPLMGKAFSSMAALESGAIANPDEKRMVGHYWLRAPAMAPLREITDAIETTLRAIKSFAAKVHTGTISAPGGTRFCRLLIVGIGGSALGPQFVADALGSPTDPLKTYFLDNTDPDGMDRVIGEIGHHLEETLTIVISKSGGTKETRNGMLETKAAYERSGLEFAKFAVAVTGRDSELDRTAVQEGWLARFPMWDWVGGRTSLTSAVGLLPAALQGINIDKLLEGARNCDEATRTSDTLENPAALLALMWFYATSGRGTRDMVILPYKDRLVLFSRYLQQLIMESIGKETDLDGKIVNQGLTVYGNKGSTDQHAYVQQLREGVNNFFVSFIEVLKDRQSESLQVEPDVTSGDYLSGFLQGTRTALTENGRESLTITIDAVNARSIGIMIALFERTVGYYASLVNVNAYHQPGVEAGKKAAGQILELQGKILTHLRAYAGKGQTATEIAEAVNTPDSVEDVFRILLHLSTNPDHGISIQSVVPVYESRFQWLA